MHPGAYSVNLSSAGSGTIVRIVNEDEGRSVMTLPQSVSTASAWTPTRSAVVLSFACTNGNCELSSLRNDNGAVYTFTHPYGVDVLPADDLGSVNVTNDAGTAGFTGPLAGPVGPFLVWDASPPAPPPDTIGTPAVTHRVTGSPCGTNFFRVDGPGLPQGGVQTDLFSVAGLKTGIIRAMGGTGKVVTAAGLVFAFTMGSMVVSDLRVVGQIGTTIGLGLLFDTLIVRSFMMPSVAALLGRWFWWPQKMRPGPASYLLRRYGPRPVVRSLLQPQEAETAGFASPSVQDGTTPRGSASGRSE